VTSVGAGAALTVTNTYTNENGNGNGNGSDNNFTGGGGDDGSGGFVPTSPITPAETEIDEPETPLVDNPEDIPLEEPRIPLSESEHDEESLIEDTEVPLSDMPRTGLSNAAQILTIGLIASVFGLGILCFISARLKKGKSK